MKILGKDDQEFLEDDSMTAVEEEEDGRDRVSSRSYGEVDLGDQRTDYMQGGLFLLLLTWSLLSFMSEPCKSQFWGTCNLHTGATNLVVERRFLNSLHYKLNHIDHRK